MSENILIVIASKGLYPIYARLKILRIGKININPNDKITTKLIFFLKGLKYKSNIGIYNVAAWYLAIPVGKHVIKEKIAKNNSIKVNFLAISDL
jgi:hypothetical protein